MSQNNQGGGREMVGEGKKAGESSPRHILHAESPDHIKGSLFPRQGEVVPLHLFTLPQWTVKYAGAGPTVVKYFPRDSGTSITRRSRRGGSQVGSKENIQPQLKALVAVGAMKRVVVAWILKRVTRARGVKVMRAVALKPGGRRMTTILRQRKNESDMVLGEDDETGGGWLEAVLEDLRDQTLAELEKHYNNILTKQDRNNI
ncbi:hypothetical protein FA13DRAFT_1704917 [Coprinellus micaceus]|uniref:Uncharacterized protein n=1 Tax=Coprinellus micaceus TaxID=71717 RepID=A0A4Y7TU96_COPMI|nr:hypothetical protein FA13DRAFT_1704917 [Coprinellus micaceus]